MKRFVAHAISAALIALTPSVVFAHPGHDHGAHHFVGGFIHPFTGIDHILALAAVGMWAAQLGGRARWLVPLGFLSMIIVGGSLAASRAALPVVEGGILASILVTGLLLLFALRMPALIAAALAGFFALFHGYAHVAEMPADASMIPYAIGFVLGSAMLLGLGCLVGRQLTIARQSVWLRGCGGAIALVALMLAVG